MQCYLCLVCVQHTLVFLLFIYELSDVYVVLGWLFCGIQLLIFLGRLLCWLYFVMTLILLTLLLRL